MYVYSANNHFTSIRAAQFMKVAELKLGISVVMNALKTTNQGCLKMSKENNGGPAFPEVVTEYDSNREPFVTSVGGMSVRSYAAIKAMQALIIAGLNTDAWEDYDDLAKSACIVADALIKELEK